MRRRSRTTRLAFLLCIATLAAAEDTRELVNLEMSKPTIRGAMVFKSYCVLCHGQRGDGVSRAARLHSEVNLAIAPQTMEYYKTIVREGGKTVGASQYMPPWGDELSEEQISDVAVYLGVISDPVRRGDVVYKTNCVLCHGVKADGNGRAAALFTPRPADLTRSTKSDRYKEDIIRNGGASMGRSPSMPAWEERIADQEIQDVISYLKVVSVVHHNDNDHSQSPTE